MNCPLFVQRTNQTRAGALQGLLSFSMLMKKSSCLSLQKEKKKISLGKKKKFKKKEAWRQEPHGTPEERGTGTKSTKPSPAEPQPETAPGNPFPLLQSIKRKWKPTRSRDGFIKPPQKLNCSWEPLFFPPRSEEFSSDRKDDFSCVHHP